MKTDLLCFDPGFGGTGWACWKLPEEKAPRYTGIVTPERTGRIEDRSWDLCHAVKDLLQGYNPRTVKLEWPSFFGSHKGQTAAESGDLVKLVLAASTVLTVCHTLNKTCILVGVNEWKGQLPKRIVEGRIRKILGPELGEYDSHEWDAVGLGLHHRGLF